MDDVGAALPREKEDQACHPALVPFLDLRRDKRLEASARWAQVSVERHAKHVHALGRRAYCLPGNPRPAAQHDSPVNVRRGPAPKIRRRHRDHFVEDIAMLIPMNITMRGQQLRAAMPGLLDTRQRRTPGQQDWSKQGVKGGHRWDEAVE